MTPAERTRKWNADNPGRNAENCRAYRAAHLEEITAKRQTKEYRDAERRATFLRVHGITLDERDAIIELQGGKCPICQKALTAPKMDHNHDTEQRRSVLCDNCNLGLGHFKDNPEFLEMAAVYLRGWESWT